MIRVLANDGLEASAVEALQALGAEVVTDHIDQAVLGEAVRDYDVLIVRSATKVTADVSEKANPEDVKKLCNYYINNYAEIYKYFE